MTWNITAVADQDPPANDRMAVAKSCFKVNDIPAPIDGVLVDSWLGLKFRHCCMHVCTHTTRTLHIGVTCSPQVRMCYVCCMCAFMRVAYLLNGGHRPLSSPNSLVPKPECRGIKKDVEMLRTLKFSASTHQLYTYRQRINRKARRTGESWDYGAN